MQKKVHLVKYIASETYAELISTALRQNDILSVAPEIGNDIEFLNYVKENTTAVSEYDAIILDISALANQDNEILEALETIRYWDDQLRIILIASNRYPGDRLLRNCFLTGIYNITCSNDFVEIRDFLQKSLTEGLSYKDAIQFKKEVSKTLQKLPLKQDTHKVIIALCGSQERIGVTHNVLTLCVTLRKMGYLVAAVEVKPSTDYLSIMKSYQKELKEEYFFTLEGIDMYPYQKNRNFIEIQEKPYHFIVMDMGTFNNCNKELLKVANELLFVCGSKPWELDKINRNVLEADHFDNGILLFNLTDKAIEKDIKKKMEGCREIFFTEYCSNPLKAVFINDYIIKYQSKKEEKKKFLWLKDLKKR